MNFSSDSVKHESKSQNEDFCFDVETPRGHFFAVLDLVPHDLANLNATLKGKLETIVGSFVSLSRFSADLFLGFLAKEINNFLHNLREQAGGPELLGSAALCLVSGNRLTYFLCGDVGISIHNGGRVLPLQAAESEANRQLEKLGARSQETPLTDAVQAFTLQDNDIVLVMTQGLEGAFETQELSSQIGKLDSADPKLICDALMKASASSKDDRTLVVISGPYERYVDPALADLSKAVVSLEARLNALVESDEQKGIPATRSVGESAAAQLEQKLAGQIVVLKEELRGKAGRIDLLELDEKVKSFGVVLAGKADTAEVLRLQSDVLKLSLAADAASADASQGTQAHKPPETIAPLAGAAESNAAIDGEAMWAVDESDLAHWQRSFLLKVAAVVLVIGFGAAFAGAWLQSRLMTRSSDTGAPAATLPEQADQNLQTTDPTPRPAEKSGDAVTEVAVRPGDSLKKLARQHNVPTEKLMELNPTITRWPMIKPGQKILVPSSPNPTP